MSLELHYGDILDLEVDAIVNPSNTTLQHTGSLAASLAAAGGPTIQEESDALAWCDLGSAVVTGGGALRAKHIIHVPTVDYTTNRRASLEQIDAGTRAALRIAEGLGQTSIAFPLLGAGVVGLKASDVATAMTRAMAGCELRSILCVHYQAGWDAVQAVVENGVA